MTINNTKKICLYTCIMGSYDSLTEISKKEDNIDYICFTNNKNLFSNTWKVICLENEEKLNDHLLSRKIKILGHPYILDNYDISIYIDGSISMKKSIKTFMKKYVSFKEYNFIGFVHSKRDCIYDEAKACIALKKDIQSKIELQMKKYRKEGYPEHNGLIEATILFRKLNDPLVMKTMKMWFEQVSKYSKKDQLSFNYCINKTGLKWGKIPLEVFNNDYFKSNQHRKGQQLEYYNTKHKIIYFSDKDNNEIIVEEYYKYCDGVYIANFSIPKKSTKTIFIPILDNICYFEIVSIKKGEKNVNYEIISDYKIMNEKKIFTSFNPKLMIKDKGNITLKIRLEKVDILELIEETVEGQKQIRHLNEYATILKNEIEKVLNSKSWKFTKPLRFISSLINHKGK
ncbi:MAG: DUF616 domain-containing protein [Bacilli bacterium]|nr:DUF616 domain-containing protein [Bacilli bacterium]